VIWAARVAALVAAVVLLGLALNSVIERAPVADPSSSAGPGGANAIAVAVPSPTPRPPATRAAVVSREVLEAAVPPTSTPTPFGAPPTVAVVDFGFQPYQVTVHVGQSVVWRNEGSSGHDVTGGGPSPWRSGPLEPMTAYWQLFGSVGVYDYQCTIHPEMRGRVLVEP
jgi:plastocyanin